MKNTKEYYDKTAKEMADKWYEDEYLLPYLKEFIEYLPEHPRVLDLCCGCGYDSMRLNKLGAEVVGLDFSTECIKIAKERNPDITFYEEDILNDYSYAGKFNGAICIRGLVHIRDDELPRVFANLHKTLEPNSYIFLAVKDGTGKNILSSFFVIDDEEYDNDFYNHTLEELIRYSAPYFTFQKEIVQEDSIWKYYVMKKK
ncbi:MAG: class I SAM-dependent methyltransferase [Clostridia bacterium]|nr:class I SAM-dependent methyltransferase [Clostridia bacterium]